MPVRRSKSEDSVEEHIRKLMEHRQFVVDQLGDTEYANGYVDGLIAAMKITAGMAEIEKAIVTARIETREQ